MNERRVVVTGMGVVTALGCSLDSFWNRLISGYSGVRTITKFDVSSYPVKIAAEVIEFEIDAFISRKEQRRMDQFCHYAVASAKMAIKDSGLDMSAENPDKVGVIVTSGVGGLQTLEEQHIVLREKGPSRCSPFMIPQMIINMPSGLIAIEYNMKGPNYAVVSACASSAHAIGDALRLIQRGDADVMITGGAEAGICELSLAGFSSMRALSARNDEPQKASRPFDADRDGFVLGDGAACLVLEEYEHARRRGARIYSEIAGFGMSCDAFHITAPSEDGSGAAKAMLNAMNDASVSPEDVGYINAHGTSTPLNDKVETKAIKLAMGQDRAKKVFISSSKSMTGHLLGAAGSLESVVCSMVLYKGVVPPTINYEKPDPDCDLDYVPNCARNADIKVCLNNSLGFGGHNACVVLRKI